MSKKVALMCGHGKSLDGSWDSGCTYGGYTEAGLMLPITKAAVKYLRSYGVKVISDADNNNNKNMIADARWANKEKADIYVSVHCDYSKAPTGVMPLYVSTSGKKLATSLNNSVKKGMGMKSRGVVKRTDLWELNGTDMTACILETGAIKADLKILKNKADAYGKCIAQGICDYLGIKTEAEKTTEVKKDVKTLYRVRKSWDDGKSQVGAFESLENAKISADVNGMNVYDNVGNLVYEGQKETSSFTGELPTLKLVKTNAEVIADAVRFAKWIASDQRFGYGRMGGSKYKGTKEYKITHSGGCHFCGTNATNKVAKAKKAGISNPEEWEYTYVCNTFVHASYAHAGVQAMLSATKHAWWTSSYQKSKIWKQIKKTKISDLKAGDVLGNDTHYVMYIGDGKGIQATSKGNARTGTDAWENSISTFDISSFFKKAKYIFRYTGSVNSTVPIKYGEVGKRVELWQNFLNWYSNGEVESTGCFDDSTLTWTKAFQEEKLGKSQADGIVGADTLAAASEVIRK